MVNDKQMQEIYESALTSIILTSISLNNVIISDKRIIITKTWQFCSHN